MILVEFTIDHPILREPLQAAPDATVEWEQTYDHPDGPSQMFFWTTTDDYDAFDDALEHDTTIRNPTVIADTMGRRLYRVDFTHLGRMTDLYPEVLDVGGVFQHVTADIDGWHLRIQFPDRPAFGTIYQFCKHNDVQVTVDRIYESTHAHDDPGISLTDTQRETLRAALDTGYLDIPRETSLAELATHLDISQSAASERFRRATRTLIQQTIHDYPE